MAINQHIT